jgi:hypothetical protein
MALDTDVDDEIDEKEEDTDDDGSWEFSLGT